MIRIFLIVFLFSFSAYADTIWNSTERTMASSVRIPVDTSSVSGPGHITGDQLLTYIEANYSLTSDLVGTGTNSIKIRATTADKVSSIAIGQGSIATGSTSENYQIAIGDTASAYQTGSISIGRNATSGSSSNANTEDDIAIGRDSVADGRHSVAVGYTADAGGTNAVSIGDASTAQGGKSVAVGNQSVASGDRGIAIGSNAEATHDNSIVFGELVSSSAANQVTYGNLMLRLGAFNVSSLPAATSYEGHLVYVSNGDSGSPSLAVSNGTNWLRISLGAAVSGS